MDMTENKDLVDWLIRVEGKLDSSLQRITAAEVHADDRARRIANIENMLEGNGQPGIRQGLSSLNQRVGTIESKAHLPSDCPANQFVLTLKAGTDGALMVGKVAVGLTRTVWAMIIGVAVGIPAIIAAVSMILSHWK